ncbi:MAG: DUF4129 domain-containing protein [Albimonas sp.]|uniref:DUF4129 domain-containing protein n=1 Tax=Albimonas sp. TaxID=1872425 RepID=UPI0040564AE8
MRNSLILFLAFAFAFALASGPGQVLAQSPEATRLDLSDSGRSYLEAVGRRVNADVGYYSPDGAAPELATQEQLQPQARAWDGELDADAVEILLAVAAALVLAAALYQAWRFGAPASVSLRSRPRNAAAAARGGAAPAETAETAPPTLADVMAGDEWNAAVVARARAALARPAARHDLRWRTSWTARELLGRLPREEAERLRPLVAAAEHVQFGGRQASEAEVARFAPLLGGEAA